MIRSNWSNDWRRMILTSYNLVSWASWTFSTTQHSAFVHRLVNATKSIVFVFALVFSIAVIWTWFVCNFFNNCLSWPFLNLFIFILPDLNDLSHFRFLSYLIYNLTLLKSFLSDSVHLFLRNRFSSNSLSSINGHKLLVSDSFNVISWDKLGIRNISILFLHINLNTKLWSSFVFNLLYCPLLTIEVWAASGV